MSIENIAPGARENITLAELGENNIGDEGAQDLPEDELEIAHAPLVVEDGLEGLYISETNIGDEGAQDLSEDELKIADAPLVVEEGLEELYISETNIRNAGAQDLPEDQLDASFPGFGDVGVSNELIAQTDAHQYGVDEIGSQDQDLNVLGAQPETDAE